MVPGGTGAESDAAKLQHSVFRFAVEACSEFPRMYPFLCWLGVLKVRLKTMHGFSTEGESLNTFVIPEI